MKRTSNRRNSSLRSNSINARRYRLDYTSRINTSPYRRGMYSRQAIKRLELLYGSQLHTPPAQRARNLTNKIARSAPLDFVNTRARNRRQNEVLQKLAPRPDSLGILKKLRDIICKRRLSRKRFFKKLIKSGGSGSKKPKRWDLTSFVKC